jgi:hypothetical protein
MGSNDCRSRGYKTRRASERACEPGTHRNCTRARRHRLARPTAATLRCNASRRCGRTRGSGGGARAAKTAGRTRSTPDSYDTRATTKHRRQRRRVSAQRSRCHNESARRGRAHKAPAVTEPEVLGHRVLLLLPPKQRALYCARPIFRHCPCAHGERHSIVTAAAAPARRTGVACTALQAPTRTATDQRSSRWWARTLSAAAREAASWKARKEAVGKDAASSADDEGGA